ncbi:hypothetical protein D3C83_84660 [compost metagenome]
MLHEAQQWLVDRGLLSRELSLREAVEQAPGSGDAVGTVVAAEATPPTSNATFDRTAPEP